MDPRIEKETDPQRILSCFTTHLEVKGRMKILKSLALLKSKFVNECKKNMSAQFVEPMEGLEDILKQSLNDRLKHFIEPGY